MVTASGFPESADKLSFGVTVITAEEIRASGVSTVNEALMKLAGVPGRVDLYGGGDYALDLRGFGSGSGSNQAFIVDGVKVNEGDLGGTRLAGIPIDTVERIEVVRGNSAVLYGEGATAGAIVITTKAGRTRSAKHSAQTYAAIGSHDLLDARASVSLALGDIGIDAAVNTRSTDNHRVNFASETEGASISARWEGDDAHVGVRHSHDSLETGLPGSLSAQQYADDPSQASSLTNHASIRNTRYGVFGGWNLGGWQFTADAGWRSKQLQSASGYAYEIDATTQTVRARRSAHWAGLANNFIAGIDHAEWERDVPGAFGSLSKQRSNAVYAKDDLTLPVGTRLNAGLRVERLDKESTDAPDSRVDSTQRAWELGALQPIGNAAVYGRVGRSFRLANVDEIGFTSFGVALRPQTSRDIELGARWRSNATRVELRAYRSRLTDEIAYDALAPNAFMPGANVNLDPTRRQGLELELTQALSRATHVRVQAARRDARFVAGPYAGRHMTLVPRQSVSVQADWSPSDAHRFDAIWRAVSSQHPDAANACAMPGYATADLRYAFRQPGLELAFGVGNIADRKHYTLAFRCVDGQPSAIYPEAGRTITGSLRLNF